MLERHDRVGERLSVGVVEVHGEAVGPDIARAERRQEVDDLAGRRHADGVAQRHLMTAHRDKFGCHRCRLLGGHLALPWIAEAHRDVAACRDTSLPRLRHDRGEGPQRLGDRAVQVAPREALRGAREHRDLRCPTGEGPLEATLVRHQDGVSPRERPERGHDLLGIRELGHPRRRHEAGQLDRSQSGSDKSPDELDLDRGAQHLGLVLQAVSRSHLVDLHVLGKSGEVRTLRRPHRASPVGAWPPARGAVRAKRSSFAVRTWTLTPRL